MKKILCFLLVAAPFSAFAQQPCGVKVIHRIEDYRRQAAENPENELVEIKKEIPGIRLDVRYATSNNLVKRPVYKQARAFARRPVVDSLKKIQADLKARGLGLKIYDGYRPYYVTCIFYAEIRDTVFVAAPWRGSRHNRGCAVDLTLVDLKTGRELPMPSGYDETTERAFHNYEGGTAEQRANRAILREAMTRRGFEVYEFEWWHYDFAAWRRFDLTDIPFEELSKK
jgi:zinc D-Ala-D-Ala dipeptidase